MPVPRRLEYRGFGGPLIQDTFLNFEAKRLEVLAHANEAVWALECGAFGPAVENLRDALRVLEEYMKKEGDL